MNIPFQSVLQPIKNIEERNKAFAKLSNENKRKEIALDALNVVRMRKVLASTGSYWGDTLRDIRYDSSTSKEFQERVLKLPRRTKDTNCEVCQRGLIMLSQLRLGNSIDPGWFIPAGSDNIIRGFTMNKMIQMEEEYENNAYDHPHTNNTKQKLANICCNIIANGDFNTKDKTDYLTAWEIKL